MFSNNVPGADSICGLKPDCTALQRGQHGQHVDGAKMRRLSLQSETFAHYLCPQPLSDLCISAPALVRPLHLCPSPCQTFCSSPCQTFVSQLQPPVRPLCLSSSPCQTFVSQLQPLSDLCISAPALVRPLYLCSSVCQTLAVVSLLQPLLDLCISDPTLVRPFLCSKPLSDLDCSISTPARVRPLLKPLSDLRISAPVRVRRWL